MSSQFAITNSGTLLSSRVNILRLSTHFVASIAAGSNNEAVNFSLAPTSVIAGSYTNIVVDATGRLTYARSLVWNDILGIIGVIPSLEVTSAVIDNNFTVSAGVVDFTGASTALGTATGVTAATADDSTTLATTAYVQNQNYLQSVSYSGAATGITSNGTCFLTLASSGATAGTYNMVAVNAAGIVTSGSNPTSATYSGTLSAGYVTAATGNYVTSITTTFAVVGAMSALSGTFSGTLAIPSAATAPSPAVAGNVFFNTALNAQQVYNGSAWLTNANGAKIVMGTIGVFLAANTMVATNAIPVSTGAKLLFSQAVTPTSTASKMMVHFSCLVDCNSGSSRIVTFALFRNNNCIGVVARSSSAANSPDVVSMLVFDSPAATVSTTYAVYFGVNASATAYINTASSASYGNIGGSNGYMIQEIL